MQITHEQAEERLNNPENLANRFSVTHIPIMRPHRGQAVPKRIKEEIAIRARAGENQQALADEFGISQPTVHTIEAGKVAIPEVKVTEAVKSIEDRAMERLMSTLGFLDNDKLSGCNAKDLSTIAGNMSKVISQTRPKEKSDNQTTVIIYAPEQRSERTFQTVQV